MHDAARRPDILPDFDANGIGGMLVLSRRVDERIVIDESIVITVIEVRGNRVRFGFQAREGNHTAARYGRQPASHGRRRWHFSTFT